MPKTLLLADDSVTIQKVVGISFASEDAVIIAVDNGDDAIARARQERPDAILADVVMPGKNGYEVCEAIKADPALAHIPVLLLTGTFEAFDAERAERVGAAGHIAKPFESQTLVDMVNDLFTSVPAPNGTASTNAPAAEPTMAMDTPPAAQTPSEPNTDAFDFFDDDLEAADAVAEPEPLAYDGSHEFAAGSAFEFGDEDLLAPVADPRVSLAEPVGADADSELSAGPVDETPVAVMASSSGEAEPIEVVCEDAPDRDLAVDSQLKIDSDLGEPVSVASELDAAVTFDDPQAPADSLTPLDTASRGGVELFDFGFESTSAEEPHQLATSEAGLPLVDADDLAQAATLYPEGASDFDVAASDFGPDVVNEREATVLVGLEQSEHSGGDALEHEPLGGLVLNPSDGIAVEAVASAELADGQGAAPLAMTDPVELVSSEVAAPFEAPTDDASDLLAGSLPDSLPRSSSDSISETAARAEAALEQIEPQLREQLHDTLEKIAWESFGDLTEAIVRQSVEKVEQIAWEVVPQLIETLVREEIRKMKGEPPSQD
ncbi:MAG: response regulator [Myxococcota bacterium]